VGQGRFKGGRGEEQARERGGIASQRDETEQDREKKMNTKNDRKKRVFRRWGQGQGQADRGGDDSQWVDGYMGRG
jgi:hypothetical protein